MKLTIFIGSLIGGGAERVACEIANHMTENGHRVEILIVTETSEHYYLNDNVKCVPLSGKGGKIRRVITKIVSFMKYIKNSDTDLYLVMLPQTIQLMLFFRKIIKQPIIIAERNDPNSYQPNVIKRLLSAMKKGDGFVFQTEDAKNFYLSHGINVANSIIVPNAINKEFIRPVYSGVKSKRIVGVGRMKEQKNFPMLINAFYNVSAYYPEFHLCLYGEGPLLEQYKSIASELGIAERVHFMGYVDDIGGKIADASVFVLSSNFEGMPNALMEAMALGIPCIATNCPCGGPKFLINSGENGILIPVGDVEALTESLNDILSNNNKAQLLGNNARRIIDRLSPEKIYKQWEDFLVKNV